MSKKLLFRLVVLVAAMMCALGASASEAYACYTSSNTTLTFYYDGGRSTRTGTTYDLNTGNDEPGWMLDGTCFEVTQVVFDPSFFFARPTSTSYWFCMMDYLESITDIIYLDTSDVQSMNSMFSDCNLLTSLDLRHFDTRKVIDMAYMFADCRVLPDLDLTSFSTSNVWNMTSMFRGCSNMTEIEVGENWVTRSVTSSSNMFYGCTRIIGNQGTTYSASHVDKTYAHIDGGSSNPGYLSRGKDAYACYTSSNSTLTFYYDRVKGSRTGEIYSLGYEMPEGGAPFLLTEWSDDHITQVVFNSSFSSYYPISTAFWFWNHPELQSITGLNYLNTSKVTDMQSMFRDCSGLTSLNLSGFSTSKVVLMDYMFYGCSGLTSLYLGSFFTDNVQYMDYMFSGCTGLTSINLVNFRTPKVINMRDMFSDCSSLTSLNLSRFNTANVRDMRDMFYGCSSLTSLDLSGFNTARVANMDGMFYSCRGLTSLDLSGFNTASAVDMHDMFCGCGGLTSLNLSRFNTANVRNMSGMFYGCTNLRTIYAGSGWTTSAVTSSMSMFRYCTNLVGGQGTTFDANHTDKAYARFDGGPSNPGYFTELKEAYACYTPSDKMMVFYYDSQRYMRPGDNYDLNTGSEYPGWFLDVNYFNGCKYVIFDQSFANYRPTSTAAWFMYMEQLESIGGIQNLNTSSMTYMDHMFYNCTGLTSLDVSGFNTANVTDMVCMFSGCSGLTSLDLRGFNTANVTDMAFMFDRCTGLTSLNVSNFNTSKVTDMQSMFRGCTNLKTIYAGRGWTTSAVTASGDMFLNSTKLVGGKGTTYNSNHVDKAYAHIDGGTSNPGYLSEWKEAYACYTPSNTTLTFYYDGYRSSRTGTTFDLNAGNQETQWERQGVNTSVTRVAFDPSFTAARPTTTYSWFYDMRNLQSITGISYLNTSEVTSMSWMFTNCENLTGVDVSNFNTSNVIEMAGMFKSTGLTSLDLSNFNTAKVILMGAMFDNCPSLTSVDVSSFNTSKVIEMQCMFRDCVNLTTIYGGSGWNISAMYYSNSMFLNSTKLVGGQGTTYDADHIDAAYAHIDGGPSNPGYFTAKNAFLRGDVDGDTHVDINDVTKLIGVVLGTTTTDYNAAAADCDVAGGSGSVDINDVTALISYVLNGSWN